MTLRTASVAAGLVGLVALAGCTGSANDGADTSVAEQPATESVDDRSAVLAEIGAPDAFVVSVDEVDGEPARFESWTYYDADTQIDFLDGTLLWDIEIEPIDDGSFLPLQYAPGEFTMLASKADVVAELGGVELSEVDTTAFEVEGAELLAGEQLLLAFVDDGLVLRGRWGETSSAAPCGSSGPSGTEYWGEIEFTFSADFSSFTGTWNYCGNATGGSWSGDLIG